MPIAKPQFKVTRRLVRGFVVQWTADLAATYSITLVASDGNVVRQDDIHSPYIVTGLAPHARYRIALRSKIDQEEASSDELDAWTAMPPPPFRPLLFSWVKGRSIVVQWNLKTEINVFDPSIAVSVEVGRLAGVFVPIFRGLSQDTFDDSTAPPGTSTYALRFVCDDPMLPGSDEQSPWSADSSAYRDVSVPNGMTGSSAVTGGSPLAHVFAKAPLAYLFFDEGGATGGEGTDGGDVGDADGGDVGDHDGDSGGGKETGDIDVENDDSEKGPDDKDPVDGGRVIEHGMLIRFGSDDYTPISGTEYSADGNYVREVTPADGGGWEPKTEWHHTSDTPSSSKMDETEADSSDTDSESSEGAKSENSLSRPVSFEHNNEHADPDAASSTMPGSTRPVGSNDGPSLPASAGQPPTPSASTGVSGNGGHNKTNQPDNKPQAGLLNELLDSIAHLHGGAVGKLLHSLGIGSGALGSATTNGTAASATNTQSELEGPYVVSNAENLIGDDSSKWHDQCARLVQGVLSQQGKPIGQTVGWRPMERVKGNKNLRPGTAIATFKNGVYPQEEKSQRHTAIFMGFAKNAIVVIDQNITTYNGKVGTREIRFDNPGKPQNNADEYWVIGTPVPVPKKDRRTGGKVGAPRLHQSPPLP